MSDLTIQAVPVSLVHRAWPDVEAFLRDALTQANVEDYNVDQLKGMVAQGAHELFVAVDVLNHVRGAATVSYINYPNNRVAYITAIGGRLISNRDTWQQFSEILKSRGATKCAGSARESIARLWRRYNFETKYAVVETLL